MVFVRVLLIYIYRVNTRGDCRHDRFSCVNHLCLISCNCRHDDLLVYSVHATVAQVSANDIETENDVIIYIRSYTICK